MVAGLGWMFAVMTMCRLEPHPYTCRGESTGVRVCLPLLESPVSPRGIARRS